MTTDKELREVLAKYGIGLDIDELARNDRVNLYPTKYKGVHKETLWLRGRLADCPLEEFLKYCLSKTDYNDWELTRKNE